MKLPKDSLSLRAGQFELDLPFTQARTINLSPYDIYQEANIGAAASRGAAAERRESILPSRTWREGIELSGGHLYGGYHYSVAIFDQNTSGISQAANQFPYVPSATASANGGVGFSFRFRPEEHLCPRRLTDLIWSTIPRAGTTFRLPAPRARATTRT